MEKTILIFALTSISPGITFISAVASSAPAAIETLSFLRFTPPSTYLPYWLSEYSSILTTYPSVRPLASASASAFVRASSTAFFNASAYASSYQLE